MTCTLEQLKAAGMHWLPESELTGAELNKWLCDTLEYVSCSVNGTTFRLQTQAANTPPPKTVEVTQEVLTELTKLLKDPETKEMIRIITELLK